MRRIFHTSVVLTFVLGLGLIFAGSASASTDTLTQSWGNVNVDVTVVSGSTLEIDATIEDTGKDGKCVYVEYRADVQATGPFLAIDPDGVITTACGTGNSNTGSISEFYALAGELRGVEIKLCKKGVFQDPCVKKWVEPTYT